MYLYASFLSLKQEWEDNKKSLIEFIWTAHRGIKGVVSAILIQILIDYKRVLL